MIWIWISLYIPPTYNSKKKTKKTVVVVEFVNLWVDFIRTREGLLENGKSAADANYKGRKVQSTEIINVGQRRLWGCRVYEGES